MYGIRLLCQVLSVCFSAFYAWKRGESHVLGEAKKARAAQVKVVFETHRKRYGARRVSKELQAQQISVGRCQAGSLMRQQGLKAIQPKSFVPKTTDSNHRLGRSPNRLLDREPPKSPNEVFVGDITYIPMSDGGFVFLASWQDMYSRKIVGWELLRHMRTELVINALNKSIQRRKLPGGLIVHSDGGGQYASHEFLKLLEGNGFLSSMTRRDNHYDNAMAESLFSRFKAELMEKGAFDSFEDAYTEIFEYIEIYYNTQRRHSGIGYQIPQAFEKAWEDAQKLSKG
jgi:transposase InsO family protein